MGEFTAWLTALLYRGQELKAFRDDLPEKLLIELLMSMGLAVDRWMLDHWDDFSMEERIQTSQKTFDLFTRILAPTNTRD